MKLPVMLRTTHDREMRLERHIVNELKDNYMDLQISFYDANQLVMSLENRNCELSVKLTASTTRANKYEDWYNNLTYIYRDSQNELNEKLKTLQETQRELESYKKKVDGLEKLYSEYKEKNEVYKADIEKLGFVYNNMNRKLWCNDEVKRQLKNLASDIRDAEKINKNDIAKYLDGLSMIAGGGESFEFVGLGETNAKG